MASVALLETFPPFENTWQLKVPSSVECMLSSCKDPSDNTVNLSLVNILLARVFFLHSLRTVILWSCATLQGIIRLLPFSAVIVPFGKSVISVGTIRKK